MSFVPPTPDETLGVFVSPSGAATNPGTRAAPLASIDQAAALAAAARKVVFVAAGTYREQVRASVSLFGGYAADFGELDPDRFETEIVATGSTHSTVALTFERGEPTVYGFTLRGGQSTFAAAVKIDLPARPTLVRNQLHGGGRGPTPGTMTFSYGVNVPSYPQPAFTLRDCTVHGGSNQYCHGLAGCAPGCVIERNTISGGGSEGAPSSITEAIHANGGFTLADNTIDAGNGAAWARGVTVFGGRATITGNRITTPRGVWHDCLAPGTGLDHVIRGNTFDGIPDEACFAWATKLARRTWRFNEVTGERWAWQDVELVPWGWLAFTDDSAQYQEESNSVGHRYGPTPTFGQFLRDGPPAHERMPPALVDELRALILDAGCTPEALARLDARAQGDVLLRAVIARPELDEPRLRYAEHLEREGDPIGEYIRLATSIQHPKSGYVAARTQRFLELKHLEPTIAAPLAPWIERHILSRGMVAYVTMDARTFLDAGHEVFARAPVVHLDLVRARPVFAELVRCRLLARVQTLSITYGDLGDAEAAMLAASPHVRQLGFLDLCNNQIGEAGLEAITASPNLAALRVLQFMANVADDPVTREGREITDEPYYEPAGPIQARLETKYGRKVWMYRGPGSPGRFDFGRPGD